MTSTPSRFETFSAIYEEQKDAIFTYLYFRLGRDRERAEDLTGDVFYKALKAFEPSEHAPRARTWLFAIARNTLIDSYRTHKPTEQLFEDELFDEEDFEALLDTSLTAERVRAHIDELTSHQQTCINAYFFEETSTADIAERHDLSPESVRKHISRGIATLRERCSTLGELLLSFFFV